MVDMMVELLAGQKVVMLVAWRVAETVVQMVVEMVDSQAAETGVE
jgi:hypothetical protein